MVDLPSIQGPVIPPEPPGKKTERNVDSDSFHKEMHKRVERVSETDQEQKKKRKRKEESEEEEEPLATGQGPTTPPDQVTPFSLVEGKKKVSPLEMQKGAKISPLASAQPTETTTPAPPSVAPFLAVPSSEEMEDDSGMMEASFLETMPPEEIPPASVSTTDLTSAAPPLPLTPEEAPTAAVSTPPPSEEATPPFVPKETPPSPPSTEEISTPSAKEGNPPTPSEQKKTVKAGPPSPLPLKKTTKTQPLPAQPKAHPTKEQKAVPALTPEEIEEKRVTAPEIEAMAVEERAETTGFFEQFVEEKDKGLKKEIKPKETPEETEELAGGVTPVAPLPPSAYIEKEKKEEEEVTALGLGSVPSGLELPPPPLETTPSGPINPYAHLHPQVMELFDRMVGTMTVLSLSGITETVVTLDAPKFASSVFYGSQFIIQEYSSAPQAYNIQLHAGSPQALALFQGNADDLMAAFQYGNYNFRVNRLETGLLTRPLIRRKEPPSGGGEGQKGSER